jgi:hypothetical protein
MLKALDHGRLFGREEVNPRFGVNLREPRFFAQWRGVRPESLDAGRFLAVNSVRGVSRE